MGISSEAAQKLFREKKKSQVYSLTKIITLAMPMFKQKKVIDLLLHN